MHTAAVIVESLRRESIKLCFAKALAQSAAPTLALRQVEFADLTICNEDLWGDPPDGATCRKRELDAADAVLFETPARG